MRNRDGNYNIKSCFLNNEGQYKGLNETEAEAICNSILELWEKFLADNDEALELNKDYFIHTRNLYEVIKRLDKRRTYYYVFHGITDICEYKEFAIICYWINTLKPFMVVNEASGIYSCPNEMFSLYIMLVVLSAVFKDKHPNEKFKELDSKTIQDYVYNFKYCDLSREATIFFFETLARSYGIGMETNAVNDQFQDNEI